MRALFLVAALLLTACGAPGTQQAAVTQLPIPPLETGEKGADGRRWYTLQAEAGQTDFGEGRTGATMGLDGTYLGPTLRMSDGERVGVRVRNSLDEMTTVHWHGMHVPARSDGGPHSMINPGETWEPTWTVDQPAATLWYHSHPHGQTAQQVYRGMAGMLIIDDPSEPTELPNEYGVDDIPLIVQDKSFDAAGEMIVDVEGEASTGFLGDTIVTNGKIATYLPVTTEAVRLRLLNASNARFYDFAFSDGRTFDVVASDGGLLAAPVAAEQVQLSPGERAEIVVRLSAGESVDLISRQPDLQTQNDQIYSEGEFAITQLRAADTLRPSPSLPAQLADVPAPDTSAVAQTRKFRVQGRAINGRPMDMNRIDFAVPVDTDEIWEITNEDRQPHNFHVHNVQFRILDVDGRPPDATQAGWKDTVYVPPLQTARLLMRFTGATDPDVPYMFHCHLLLHEDNGVMGQFVVVAPGETAGTPPAVAHHQHG